MNKDLIRIMAVDDEHFILNLTSRVLKSLGYSNIDIESDGKIALGKLVSANPCYDIIICDLNMPEMDGVEFIRHAKDCNFSGSLILLSGEDQRMLDSTLDLAVAFNLDVLGAIQKPLNPASLSDLLAKYTPTTENREAKSFQEIEPISGSEMRNSLVTEFVNELVLHYQPKIDIKTGKIVGMEALSRWQHESRGVLNPAAFIPLAEKIGLIDELSASIYRKALLQTELWHLNGHDLKCSVNFSINSFISPGFTDLIVNAAIATGIAAENVILEITESQVMEDAINCLEVIMRLRLKKFGLSIDDFGTGNSSMSQLKKIPFSELKLDQSFVHGAAHNASSYAILESSVALGKKLGMTIVAEGVETREDWDVVESLGCDIVQGFYCAKPMNAEDFSNFLNNWSGPH